MNILTMQEISEALLVQDTNDSEMEFSGVSIDSRTIKKEIYSFPLKEKIMTVIVTLARLWIKGLLHHWLSLKINNLIKMIKD